MPDHEPGPGDRPAIAVLSTQTLEVAHETSRSLEEMTFDVTSGALASAGLTPAELDAVVISGNDQTDGRVISCMVAGGPVAGVDRDVTMIASSGDHALIYGYLRLLAGQSRNVLVVGWGKPSESVSPEHAELVSAEPYLLRRIGMNQTLAAALQASRLGATVRGGGTATSWPLTRDDLPALGDVVYAAVLGVEGSFPEERAKAWITGAGWAMGGYELGARSLDDLSILDAAVRQIVESGGPPPRDWDIAEIAAPSEPMVDAVSRHLGLDAVVNGSGGLSQRLTTPQVAGLGRMIAAVDQIGGTDSPAIAAGVGTQGFAAQGVAVMTFSSQKVNG